MSLSGRVAVVTGGGRGIGAATARALARAGADVVVTARSVAQIEGVAADIRATGRRAWALPCDVEKSDQIAALARESVRLAGHVDILVNNAGIASSAPLRTMSVDEWNRMFAVNATAVFLCTQAFLPGMLERKWGRVVTIASVAGLTGFAYISGYAASKHAVVGFTRSAAAEVAAQGITVNAVCPGYVDTDLTAESLRRIVQKTGMSSEKARESILQMNPQHRLIDPDEVAFAVASLCSEEARGINGQAIVLDGGSLRA